jgi:hypothetical protein
MKNGFLLIVIPFVAVPILLSSCDSTVTGNGNFVISDREVPIFDRLEIKGNYEVELIPASTNKITIDTDENLLGNIVTEVDNGVLTIENRKSLVSRHSIKLSVYYDQLKGLTSSGASVIASNSMVKSDYLELKFPGAGSVNLEIETEHLKVEMPGAGLIKLVGYANQQEIEMNGAGSFNAVNLVTQETKIRLNGVGNAEVNARNSLDAEINGIGSIKYVGNPTELRREIRGMGTIKAIDDN